MIRIITLWVEIFSYVVAPFLALYTATHITSISLSKKYKSLSAYERNYWCTTVCAIVHSTTTVTWSALLVRENYQTLISSTSFDDSFTGVNAAIKFFLGHTMSDIIWVMIYFSGKADDIFFLVHHIAIFIVYTFIVEYNVGHILGLTALLCEGTGPFIGFKWMMDQYGMRSNPLFILNGLIIFSLWWILRIGVYTIFLGSKWVTCFSNHGIEGGYLLMMALWAVGASLQMYWGKKITIGTIRGMKTFFKKPAKTE